MTLLLAFVSTCWLTVREPTFSIVNHGMNIAVNLADLAAVLDDSLSVWLQFILLLQFPHRCTFSWYSHCYPWPVSGFSPLCNPYIFHLKPKIVTIPSQPVHCSLMTVSSIIVFFYSVPHKMSYRSSFNFVLQSI